MKYLRMASGALLPVVKESARPESEPLISVGKTKMANEAGITEEGLKYDGYRLAVKGDNLYLLGRDTELIEAQRIFRVQLMGGAQGSIRAALGLLDRLGFRWLQPTPMGIHVPELYTISIPDDLDVTCESPFMYMQGRMFNWGDWSLANSFRVSIKAFGRGGHTWPAALPASLFEEHPERFVMRDGNVCIVAGTSQRNDQHQSKQRHQNRLATLQTRYHFLLLSSLSIFVPNVLSRVRRLVPKKPIVKTCI